MNAFFGALCRILSYSSLALGTENHATIELTTPRFVAPHGILLCFNSSNYAQAASSIAVQSLQEGGNIWETSERELFVSSPDSATRGFFNSRAQPLPYLVALNARDALSTDDYYKTSFQTARYDDLTKDQNGVQLPAGLKQQFSQVDSNTSVQDNLPEGSCILVSGEWQADTRYQLTLSFINPAPLAAAAAAADALPPSAIWMVPVTYEQDDNSSATSRQLASLRLSVRGSKQGHLCSLRPEAAALLPRMFSACDEAAAHNLMPAGAAANATSQDCVAALQAAMANDSSLASSFPFNLPPVAALPLNLSTLAAAGGNTSACPTGWLLAPRFGGECIDCTHAVIQGSRCSCMPGYSSNLIGPAACGAPLMPLGNATDAEDLARQLCAVYGDHFGKMMQGELSDSLVHTMYLTAFMRQAAYLMDWTSVQQGNVTLWVDFVTDERMPASPTRRTGIGRDCTACDRTGLFKDIYTKKKVSVSDHRFLAVNSFRLMGLLLARAGYPCRQLWDPDEPLKWMYGRYDKTMCMGM